MQFAWVTRIAKQKLEDENDVQNGVLAILLVMNQLISNDMVSLKYTFLHEIRISKQN